LRIETTTIRPTMKFIQAIEASIAT